MKQIGIALLVLVIVGCSSSKPTPKPFAWKSKAPEAQKEIQQATTQDPCSPVNLKLASEAHKKKCDPTISMSDSLSPKATPPPNKKSSR